PDRLPRGPCSPLLAHGGAEGRPRARRRPRRGRGRAASARGARGARARRDRKSTRLNSSHVSISYAVFCLKKKNDGLESIHPTVETKRTVHVLLQGLLLAQQPNLRSHIGSLGGHCT